MIPSVTTIISAAIILFTSSGFATSGTSFEVEPFRSWAGSQLADEGSCSVDAQCGFRKICEWGKCTEPECQSSSWDCASWEHCLEGRCENKGSTNSCFMDSDCTWPEECENGVCTD